MAKGKATGNRTVCKGCHFTLPTGIYDSFNYCPYCGTPAVAWQKMMESFFRRMPTAKALSQSIKQFHKNEYEAAARTALIVVEEAIRRKTGLDGHGADLVARAFAYKSDTSGSVSDPPKIRINSLLTEAERNEHDGIKLLGMGMMRGIRNIVAHSTAKIPPKTCVSILTLCDLFLDIVSDGSIANERKCIWRRVSPKQPPADEDNVTPS